LGVIVINFPIRGAGNSDCQRKIGLKLESDEAEIKPFEPDPGNAGVGSGNKKYVRAISYAGEGYGFICLGKNEKSMDKKVIIVSSGRLGDQNFFRKKIAEIDNRLIVCCDGGARYLCQSGIDPDVIIGDMDSIDPGQLARYADKEIKIIKYPANKDFTDTELALDYALGLQPAAVYIWGALGGRIDHTLANVFLLLHSREKRTGIYLVDEYCETFILDNEIAFNDAVGQTVSLMALSPKVEGVTLAGFLYPLTEEALIMGASRGISNVVGETRASIRVRSGKLLVIRYWRKDIFPEAQ
jgi:thiamine pyrophosphokinase